MDFDGTRHKIIFSSLIFSLLTYKEGFLGLSVLPYYPTFPSPLLLPLLLLPLHPYCPSAPTTPPPLLSLQSLHPSLPLPSLNRSFSSSPSPHFPNQQYPSPTFLLQPSSSLPYSTALFQPSFTPFRNQPHFQSLSLLPIIIFTSLPLFSLTLTTQPPLISP